MTDEPRLLFVFGEYPDGCVDVNDGETDVLVHVTRAEADVAIEAARVAWSDWCDSARCWSCATYPCCCWHYAD